MTAKIKLNAASGGGSFSLQAPSSSANNRVITLPDVADGTLLTNQSTGLGKVLQVVHVEYGTTVSSTSTSLVDTGLTLAITPIQTGSKMLVTVFQQLRITRAVAGQGARLDLLQDSTTRYTAGITYELYVPLTDFRNRVAMSSLHLHGVSAGTSTTYKVQGGLYSGSNSPNIFFQDNGSKSMMTIMEVAT